MDKRGVLRIATPPNNAPIPHQHHNPQLFQVNKSTVHIISTATLTHKKQQGTMVYNNSKKKKQADVAQLVSASDF